MKTPSFQLSESTIAFMRSGLQERSMESLGTQVAEKVMRPKLGQLFKLMTNEPGEAATRFVRDLLDASGLEVLIRLAQSGLYSLSSVAKCAADQLSEQRFANFIKATGIWLSRGAVKNPLYDSLDRFILTFWRLDPVQVSARKELDGLRRFPPLCRWATPAAHEFVMCATGRPDLSYQTYRQRVRRRGLVRELPVLVTKAKHNTLRDSLNVTFSPVGEQWVKSNCDSKRQNLVTRQTSRLVFNGGRNGKTAAAKKTRKTARRNNDIAAGSAGRMQATHDSPNGRHT